MPDEGRKRSRARDPVGREPPSSLVALQRVPRAGIEVPVHRHERAAAGKQELQHGHVPAEHAAPE